MSLTVTVSGNLAVLTPEGPDAGAWLRDQLDAEPWAWLGPSVVCDIRTLDAILAGFEADGGEIA